MADVGVEGDGCDMCVGSGGCDGGHQVFDKSLSRTKSSLCDVMWCGSQAATVTVVHCMLVTGNSIEIQGNYFTFFSSLLLISFSHLPDSFP
ncbi:unnamed protein product [Camellia sinensis]